MNGVWPVFPLKSARLMLIIIFYAHEHVFLPHVPVPIKPAPLLSLVALFLSSKFKSIRLLIHYLYQSFLSFAMEEILAEIRSLSDKFVEMCQDIDTLKAADSQKEPPSPRSRTSLEPRTSLSAFGKLSAFLKN